MSSFNRFISRKFGTYIPYLFQKLSILCSQVLFEGVNVDPFCDTPFVLFDSL